ncbi:UNVERIFIED_CONTAM: hypothetical protein PYX00_006897 [Menopon gallinae]|uniref:Uncharacterized protein n=1 Tax=Menopon gallinae TaxID=328185 RepID=A0AAW2HYJ2_9NEOP
MSTWLLSRHPQDLFQPRKILRRSQYKGSTSLGNLQEEKSLKRRHNWDETEELPHELSELS